MLSDDTSKTLDEIRFDPKSITVCYPPITKVRLSRQIDRQTASLPYTVNIRSEEPVGEGMGGGFSYQVGERYHTEEESRKAFEIASEALRSGGIVRIHNGRYAEISPKG